MNIPWNHSNIMASVHNYTQCQRITAIFLSLILEENILLTGSYKIIIPEIVLNPEAEVNE